MIWRLRKIGWLLLPGSLTSLITGLLLNWGVFQPLEQAAYQELFKLRGPLPWDDRVVLVAIDDESLRRLGRFPWSRQKYTDLLRRLTQAESSVVVFDLLWPESSPADTQLAAAIAEHGRVILATAWDPTGGSLFPTPQLQASALASGHVLLHRDGDSIARSILPVIRDQTALSILTVQTLSLVQAVSPPTIPTSVLWINWPDSVQDMTRYSFVDVLEDRVNPDRFRNKIVLIGMTATGLDPLVTPFDHNPPASGVYLHAAAINTLLQANPLRPLGYRWVWVVLLSFGLGPSIYLRRGNPSQQLAWVSGLSLGWILVVILLFRFNYWLPVIWPIILLGVTTIAVVLDERLRENRLLRQQITHLWQTYHADLVSRHPQVVSIPTPDLSSQDDSFLAALERLSRLADTFGRSQAMQAAIARSLPLGLLAANADGQVWFCNPLAATWLAIEVGQNLYDQLIPQWVSQADWQADWQHLHMGKPWISRELQRSDRWFKLTVELIADRELNYESNEPAMEGFVLLINDISKQKQLEADLKQGQAIAETANQAKSEFLSQMSHELRTPLNAILGFTQLMSRDRSLNPDHQEFLAIVNRSGQHLLTLINDVLDLSKIEAGRTKISNTTVHLHHLLTTLDDMMRQKAIAKGLGFQVFWAPDVPAYVITDPGKLRQILLNLLSNAIKFTKQGYVSLHVRLLSDADLPLHLARDIPSQVAANVWLLFTAEDTGIGIAHEDLPTLFEAFVQAKHQPQHHEGTGLGLTISQKFVHLMGGQITVESQLKMGSQFQVWLPVGRVSDGDIPHPIKTDTILGVAPGQPRYRVLIVEDQPANRLLLVQWLTRVGLEVREATNGQAGVTLWQEWQPHLILMDMRMPVMNGREATQRIKTAPGGAATVIIAVTGGAFETDREALLAIGCDDFIPKPIQEEVLLAKLAHHLGVEWRYGKSIAESDSEATETQLTSEDFKVMPLPWIQSLYQAAIECNGNVINQLLGQIPRELTTLSKPLIALADNYDYEKMMHLTESFVQRSHESFN